MNQIYLVGTLHFDLKGPQRLTKILEYLRPSLITLEASEELVQGLLENRDDVLQERARRQEFHDMIVNAHKLMNEEPPSELPVQLFGLNGYEVLVAKEYTKSNPDARVALVHDHETLWNLNQGIEDKVIRDARLAKQEKQSIEEYQKEQDDLYHNDQLKQEMVDRIFKPCDDIMEPRIRQAIAQNKGKQTCIIVGNGHVFGKYHNLYERLKDLNPVRVKLIDVEQFGN